MSSRIYTVHEFLEHIDKSKDAFEVKPSAVDNAVRVMTVHKTKGLEVPVVIVFGLERATKNKEEEKPLFRDNQLGLCAKSYDDDKKEIKENFFRGLFLEKMRIENLKEELRLLYVAVTRASYSMHLTLEAGKDKRREYFMGASSFTDYIPSTLEANQVSPESLIADLDEGREKRSVLVGKIDSELASKIKANLEFSYPYLESTTLPVKSSVTKATKSAKEEETPIYYISHDDETGVVRGIVAHKILELLDFDGLEKESFTIQVDKMVQNNLISSEDATLVDLEKLESAVNSFAGRVKGKKLYREQNFIAGLDSDKVLSKGSEKMLLQGIIDLLVIDEGGAEIIDYKYSMLKGESLKNKYKSQLDLYAMAVENSLNVKVKRKTLVNVLSGECVDF